MMILKRKRIKKLKNGLNRLKLKIMEGLGTYSG